VLWNVEKLRKIRAGTCLALSRACEVTMANHPTTFLPEPSWQSIVRSLGLSNREAQVTSLILGDGSCESAMAASLSISPHTVHTHLERIYRKLRVTNRSQVVSRIFQLYVNQEAAWQAAPAVYARRRPDRRAQPQSSTVETDCVTRTKS
jgi:ATP/maltotriose-dependent transcriptional regulator MalT